ncbi:MAG: DUF5005 domain-containing protein [Planctomycetota bacterium]
MAYFLIEGERATPMNVVGRRDWCRILWFALFMLQAGTASSADTNPPGQASYPGIPDPEWDEVFHRSEGWTGGDGMFTVPLGDGTTLWLFSDTWIGKVKENSHAPGARIVNNSIARHAIGKDGLPPLKDKVAFAWGKPDAEGHPTAWIRPEAGEGIDGVKKGDKADTWFWLADGILNTGDDGKPRLTLFLWRIERTKGQGVMNFRSAGGDVAIVENPQDDCSHWRLKQIHNPHAIAAANKSEKVLETSWGTEIVPEPEGGGTFLYVIGVREAGLGNKQLVVARVPAEMPERFDDWEFRTATGWSKALVEAVPVVENISNEFSITPVVREGKTVWALVYSEPFFGSKILLRVARSPLGPWSKPTPVFQVPELSRNKKYFTYAAKAHPELSRPGELLITYVVNSFDFGAMVRDASIYRPRFVRLPLREIPDP